MIEALIRDDKRLICLVTIQSVPGRDGLNVDMFIPREGKTLSGVMPAGGGIPQQVARAIMTVFPISALPTDAYQVALEKRRKEMVERENARSEGKPADSSDRSPETLDEPKTTLPEKEPDRYAGPSTEEALAELDRRTDDLDKYEKSLGEREEQLNRDIKNLRKSHPSDPRGDRPKWPQT